MFEMNAKKIKKDLISRLKNLSNQDIEKIRKEYNLQGDYETAPEGQRY